MFLDHYYSDGKLEVVVPSFVHYLEVLEGSDGDKVPGMICRKLVISYVAALDTPKCCRTCVGSSINTLFLEYLHTTIDTFEESK